MRGRVVPRRTIATSKGVRLMAKSLLAALFGGVVCLAGNALAQVSEAPTWSPKAAAAYLDQRTTWWMNWPTAARAQGTFCISCHTIAPYALGRPARRGGLW